MAGAGDLDPLGVRELGPVAGRRVGQRQQLVLGAPDEAQRAGDPLRLGLPALALGEGEQRLGVAGGGAADQVGDEVGGDVVGIASRRRGRPLAALRRGGDLVAPAGRLRAPSAPSRGSNRASPRSPGRPRIQPPAGAIATTERARPRWASRSATKPPSELPATAGASQPSSSSIDSSASTIASSLAPPSAKGGPPACPARVGANTSKRRSSAGNTGSQVRQVSVNPCSRHQRRPLAATVRRREAHACSVEGPKTDI